jgi:hypothetical protein
MRLTRTISLARASTPISVRRARAAALGAALLALAPAGAGAANYLQNGEFNSSLASWTVTNDLTLSRAYWLPLGYADDLQPAEGGALIEEHRSDAFNRFNDIRQCVTAAGLPVGGGPHDFWVFRAYTFGHPGLTLPNGAGSDAEAIIQFYGGANCTGALLRDKRSSAPLAQRWMRLDLEDRVPAGAQSVLVILQVVKRFADADALAAFDNVYFGPEIGAPPVGCVQNDSEDFYKTLCLRDGRFQVSADWKRSDGTDGEGTGVPLSDDSGAFWFFDRRNLEMIVKILDGCGLNQRYWVFAGGLTNVEVTLTVTDTRNGQTKTYKNPLNKTFTAFQDTSAFATCP